MAPGWKHENAIVSCISSLTSFCPACQWEIITLTLLQCNAMVLVNHIFLYFTWHINTCRIDHGLSIRQVFMYYVKEFITKHVSHKQYFTKESLKPAWICTKSFLRYMECYTGFMLDSVPPISLQPVCVARETFTIKWGPKNRGWTLAVLPFGFPYDFRQTMSTDTVCWGLWTC